MTTTNYCSNCGTKFEQVGVKPNFCSKCGQNLNALKRTVAETEDLDTGEEEIRHEPIDISKLKDQIKIHIDMEAPKPVTIGEFLEGAKNSKPDPQERIQRKPAEIPDGKELLKMVAKECATSREASAEVE